jgi:hypothetical protein
MKPIACVIGGKLMKYSNDPLPDECLLYPEREWVGLTDDELQWICDNGRTLREMVEFAEAALQDKNT